MEKDLIAEISARSDTFSKSHKKIADYIVKHYDKAAFITASSAAAILRREGIISGSVSV